MVMGNGLNFGAVRQRIETELLPRYQQLESREQHLVLIAAVLLPLMLIVFGWLLPLQDRQKALRAELAQVQAQAAEAVPYTPLTLPTSEPCKPRRRPQQ